MALMKMITELEVILLIYSSFQNFLSLFFFSISFNVFLPEYWDCVSRSQPHSVIYFTSLVHSFNQYSSIPIRCLWLPQVLWTCVKQKREGFCSLSVHLEIWETVDKQTNKNMHKILSQSDRCYKEHSNTSKWWLSEWKKTVIYPIKKVYTFLNKM